MAKKDDTESVQLGTQPIVDPTATPTPAPIVKGDYVDGRLTRAGMEKAIKSGGSVIYKGASITTVDGLPAESDLATSEAEVAAALDSVDAQIKALQDRKAKLNAAAK